MVVSCAPSSRGHPASAPSSSHRPSFRTALQGCASSAAALFRRHTPPPPPLSASPGRPSHGPQPSAAGLGLPPIARALASRVSSDRLVARRPRQIVPSHQVSLRRPRVVLPLGHFIYGPRRPLAARSGRGHAEPRRGRAEPSTSARDPRPPASHDPPAISRRPPPIT